MKKNRITIKEFSSDKEKKLRTTFFKLFKKCPIPDNELLSNLGLFLSRQALSNILYKHEMYLKILNIHGVVMEFGVRWGQNLALFESFRGMYEPFNHNRKIIGFDTFKGFPSTHEKDGGSDIIQKGAFNVTDKYENYLNEILEYHESESPISHIKKYELVKGDATHEIKEYFKAHPETIVAMAYFDFDIYEPTQKCLKIVLKHMAKGGIIGFDELNHPDFPGETIAFKEVLELKKYAIKRTPNSGSRSYICLE